MKKILIAFTALFFVACANQPNLVHVTKPILNIDNRIYSLIAAEVDTKTAWVKNQSNMPLSLTYDIFWYDENGVTQPASEQQDAFNGSLVLQPQQKHVFELNKPSLKSVNYRLYLR